MLVNKSEARIERQRDARRENERPIGCEGVREGSHPKARLKISTQHKLCQEIFCTKISYHLRRAPGNINIIKHTPLFFILIFTTTVVYKIPHGKEGYCILFKLNHEKIPRKGGI